MLLIYRLGQKNLLPSLSCDIPALRNRHRQVEPRATTSLPPLKVRNDIHWLALSNHDKVKIMHVPPVPSNVYVRPCDDKHEADYFQTLRMVQEYGVRAEALRKTPPCGQLVLAVHKGIYYRAKVISLESENKIRTGLVEFGITKDVNSSQLKFLPEFLKERSIHTRRVNLKEVPNESLEKRREHLETLRKNGCQLTLCFEGDLNEAKCELIVISNQLEEIEGQMDELSISSLPASSQFTDIDNINFKKICCKNVKAFILDVSQIASGQIAIVERSDLEEFLDNGAKIDKFCQSLDQTPHTPR